jgi:hypothetical protein
VTSLHCEAHEEPEGLKADAHGVVAQPFGVSRSCTLLRNPIFDGGVGDRRDREGAEGRYEVQPDGGRIVLFGGVPNALQLNVPREPLSRHLRKRRDHGRARRLEQPQLAP